MLNSVLERTGNRVLEEHDLTLPQWMALGSIGYGGLDGVTHSELGQRLMLSKAPITGVVDRLERAGYVHRVSSASDRRVSRIVITPKGETVWARVRQSMRASAENYCDCLTHDEQSTLLLLLSRLLDAVARTDPTLAPSMNEMSCAKTAAADGAAATKLSTQGLMKDSKSKPQSDGGDGVTSRRKVAKKSGAATTKSKTSTKSALIAALWLAIAIAPRIVRAQDAAPIPATPPVITTPVVTTPAPSLPNSGTAGAATGSSSVADGTQSSSSAAAALPNNGTAVNPAASANAAAVAPGLGDSRISASQNTEPISVIEAIAIALQNNPQRKAAQAALEAARARIGTARSAGGPQVALSGSVDADRGFGSTGTGNNFGGGIGGGGAGGGAGGGNVNTGSNGGFLGFDNSASLGVTAQVPIYTGGRVKASTRVAEFNAQAQASQSLQVDSELVLNVAVGYLNILRAEQLLDVADANVNVSLERRRVANVRFQAGAAPRLEVLRSDTTLADAQQRRINAVNALAQNKASVNTLMGRAPEAPLRVESIAPLAVQLGVAFPSATSRFEPTSSALPNVVVPNLSSGVTTAPPGGAGTVGGTNLPNATVPNVTTPGATLPGAVTGTNPIPGVAPNAPGATTTAPAGTTSGTTGGTQAGGISVPGVTSPGAAAPVGSGAGTVSSGTVLTQPAGGAGSTSTGGISPESTLGGAGASAAAAVNIAAAGRLAGEATTLAGQGGEALRTTAGTSRESLAVLEAQIRAAEASVDVAKAARKPNIGFNLSSFLRNPATFAGRIALSLGLNLAQTIVDSGRTRSQVREAQSLVEQLRQQLAGQRLQVANQIEQALLGLDSAQRRVSSADSAVVSGAEALRAAQLGYEAGVTTNLEVSDAQAALLAAQTDAVNTRFDLAQSQAQLAAAVGVLNPTVREAYNRALSEATNNVGGGQPATTEPRPRRRKFLGIF